MAFKLKNKGLKKIISQLKNSATMHAKQAEKLESMSSPAKLQKITPSEIRKLKKKGVLHDGSAYAVSRGPARRKKLKQGNAAKNSVEETRAKKKLVDKTKDKSPMKGKLKPCQKAAAKRKFKVYPSAYANMWASNHKC